MLLSDESLSFYLLHLFIVVNISIRRSVLRKMKEKRLGYARIGNDEEKEKRLTNNRSF